MHSEPKNPIMFCGQHVFDTIIRFRNERPIGLREQMKAVKGSFEVLNNIVKERSRCGTCHTQLSVTIMQTFFMAIQFCKNTVSKAGITTAENVQYECDTKKATVQKHLKITRISGKLLARSVLRCRSTHWVR